jgi:thiamine-phosphate pyrophosphorylase
VHHAHEADAVDAEIVDYASIGPVFATGSKPQKDQPIGADGAGILIARIRSRLPRFPCCAISGITHETAPAVIAAGADGVAVIADLFQADDVEAAARRLRETVDRALTDTASQRMPS